MNRHPDNYHIDELIRKVHLFVDSGEERLSTADYVYRAPDELIEQLANFDSHCLTYKRQAYIYAARYVAEKIWLRQRERGKSHSKFWRTM